MTRMSPAIAIAGGWTRIRGELRDSETGDRVVDYRNGEEATVEAVKAALNGRDAISTKDIEK
jgi:hypothetical protein